MAFVGLKKSADIMCMDIRAFLKPVNYCLVRGTVLLPEEGVECN